MSQFSLDAPSRRKTVKILTVGNYSVMIIDIIQGLAFVPLYLNYIGERLYGLWLGTGGILAVLAFLDMGMASLTIQRVSREYGLKNFDGVSKYFSGGLLINTGFMSLLLISGLILSYWLGRFFPNTSMSENVLLTQAFQIALIALILSLFNNTIEGTLNALQKPLMGKVFQLMGAIIGIIAVYVLLLGDNPLLAIPIGMLIRSAISLLPNIVYLGILFTKNAIPLFKYDKLTIQDYIKLTPNLMFSKFGTSLVSNIEPTLINIFISPEVAVYFSVTKKAGGLIRTVLDRIGGVIYPSMAHLFVDKGRRSFSDFFIKLLNYLLPVVLVMFLLYILFNKSFVSIWVGELNYLGDLMTILIGFSLLTSYLSNLLSYLLSTTGEIKFSSNAVFIESITKVILLYLSLMYFGVIGIPIAIGIVGLIFSFVYFKRWNRHLLLNRSQLKVITLQHLKYTSILTVLSFLFYYIINLIKLKPTLVSFTWMFLCVLLAMIIVLIFSIKPFKEYFLLKIKQFRYARS